MISEQKQSKKKGGARPGAGYPPKEIDWDEVGKAAEKQWNQKQLAVLAGCSVEALVSGIRRNFGIESAAYLALKKEVGWGKLLSKQYDMAIEGSVPLFIWMGKNYLGQTDKQHLEQEVSGNVNSSLNLKNLTTEELLTMNALLKKAELPNEDTRSHLAPTSAPIPN